MFLPPFLILNELIQEIGRNRVQKLRNSARTDARAPPMRHSLHCIINKTPREEKSIEIKKKITKIDGQVKLSDSSATLTPKLFRLTLTHKRKQRDNNKKNN